MSRRRPDLRVIPHGDHFLLADVYGLRPVLPLSGLQLAIYDALASGLSSAAIAKRMRTHVALSRAHIDELAQTLEQAGVFEGPHARADQHEAYRRALVGDTLVVPGTPDTERVCRALLDEARIENDELGVRD